MIAFIDAHRDQFGVELICRVLRAAIPGFLTARGYRAARVRPVSDREIRDEQLIADLRTVHKDNFSVYGVKKMHAAMKRRGWHLGREQTRRLMHKAGLRGAAGQAGVHHGHRPSRFAAGRPGQSPVRRRRTEPTVGRRHHLRTDLAGFCYTAFVTDVCTRKIVGWAVSTTMRTADLPLQAFNHAVWQSNSDLSELVHHSDRGSQRGFNWSTQHYSRSRISRRASVPRVFAT